jgi:DNA-binding LacI/PurR family transcriptional regulator
VPNDLSLVGYDDIPMSIYLVPRLTTVTKNVHELGRKAFEVLLERMQNPDLPLQKIHGPAKLIIRESTGPAPF